MTRAPYGTCPDCREALEPGGDEERTSYWCEECYHDVCPACWPVHNGACPETIL